MANGNTTSKTHCCSSTIVAAGAGSTVGGDDGLQINGDVRKQTPQRPNAAQNSFPCAAAVAVIVTITTARAAS